MGDFEVLQPWLNSNYSTYLCDFFLYYLSQIPFQVDGVSLVRCWLRTQDPSGVVGTQNL